MSFFPDAFGIGNLLKKPEGLRTSRNDSEWQECRLTNNFISKKELIFIPAASSGAF
jgi:hypothetical protein